MSCRYNPALGYRVLTRGEQDQPCPHDHCTLCNREHLDDAHRETMNGAGRCANTIRPLTRSLDLGEEGLAMKATRTCSVDGCDLRVVARGWCTGHYSRWRKTGEPLPRARPTLRDRLLSRIDVRPAGYVTDCWLSTRAVGTNGYTHIKMLDRSNRLLHRVAYEEFIGPIPAGLTIDHLCRNKTCCNPDHLEAVPQRVNSRRHFRSDERGSSR